MKNYITAYRIGAVLLLILWGVSLPVGIFFGAFGLVGSTASYIAISVISYLFIPIICLYALFKQKGLALIWIALIFIGLGFHLDQKFWTKHNADYCTQLRSDPNCTEDEHGFRCFDPETNTGSMAPKSICADEIK